LTLTCFSKHRNKL